MKKLGNVNCSVLSAFLFLFILSDIVNAGYRLDWVSIQRHTYEFRKPNNTLVFDLLDDDDNYVSDLNVITSVNLIDPNGNVVDTSFAALDGPMEVKMAEFDVSNAAWVYQQSSFHWTGFWYTIEAPLIIGPYKLEVTTNDQVKHEAIHDFQYLLDLPIIKSRTFQIHSDSGGDIYWMWDIPKELLEISKNYNTTIRVGVGARKNQKLDFLVWTKVPIHMGFLFIPQNVVQEIISKGDDFIFMLQARTNDNRARSYAKSIVVNDLSSLIPIIPKKNVVVVPLN